LIKFAALFENQLMSGVQLVATLCGGIASTYGFINAFWISPYLCLVCLTMHSTNYILLLITLLKVKDISQLSRIDGRKKQR